MNAYVHEHTYTKIYKIQEQMFVDEAPSRLRRKRGKGGINDSFIFYKLEGIFATFLISEGRELCSK